MNRIIPNNYAPKCPEMNGIPNSHGVFYGACNFRCAFCGMANRGDNGEDISENLRSLVSNGANIKFSGGEPTLDPRLFKYLGLARDLGGVVFLDSNGSRPDVLKPLLDAELVDVLGLSLKGITPEEAETVSGVPRKLCWDNPIQSIGLGAESKARTLVTLVFWVGHDTEARLESFYALLRDFDVWYKINGLMPTGASKAHGLRPMQSDELESAIQKWVERHTDLRGRVVYVPDKSAVRQYDKIKFY